MIHPVNQIHFKSMTSSIKINDFGIAVGSHDQHEARWIQETGRLDHDWFTTGILQNFIRPSGIIDIGANIGTHTIFYERVANSFGNKVYAFEANPVSFKCLSHNCKAAVKYPVALGEEPGLVHIHQQDNLGSVHVSRHSDSSDLTSESIVPCMPLDSFLLEDIGFIKIDVEGFEEFVLKGSSKILARNRPLVWIEISPGHLSRAGSSVENIISLFSAIHYFPLFAKGIPEQSDVMFVPNELQATYAAKMPNVPSVASLVTDPGMARVDQLFDALRARWA